MGEAEKGASHQEKLAKGERESGWEETHKNGGYLTIRYIQGR